MDGGIFIERQRRRGRKKAIVRRFKWRSMRLLVDSKRKWNS